MLGSTTARVDAVTRPTRMPCDRNRRRAGLAQGSARGRILTISSVHRPAISSQSSGGIPSSRYDWRQSGV